jgi:hypothetical protein
MAEIRNYTMNFSSDITSASQKLVSTEMHGVAVVVATFIARALCRG